MKTNEAPEKIYYNGNGDACKLPIFSSYNIEYVRTDVFIDKACDYLYKYNQDMVKKYGAKATLGCSEFTINVTDFKNHMKGE